MAQIERLTIKGFKSIKSLENFELRSLNVLIGPNGVGKSNFIGALRFLSEVAGDNFSGYVQKQGKAPALFHGGLKKTQNLAFEVYAKPSLGYQNGYLVSFEATNDNRLIFSEEETWVLGSKTSATGTPTMLGRNHEEALIRVDARPVSKIVRSIMQSWRQYHFHDTSDRAAVKLAHRRNDTLILKTDAGNLAAYLAMLRESYSAHYSQIIETIRLVAPFFGDFVKRPELSDLIELEWTQRNDPDTPYSASSLSDGTLRFICLTTLLLQPPHKLPDTVLIDEPELGLHPFAIGVLADMLKQVAETRQLIVSTQSVELLNALSPEDIIVVDRVDEESVFRRCSDEELGDWLKDYSLGDLWLRNVLGGRP
jgi:predicted ATPase